MTSAPMPFGPLILCALTLIEIDARMTKRVDLPGKALRRVDVKVGVRTARADRRPRRPAG